MVRSSRCFSSFFPKTSLRGVSSPGVIENPTYKQESLSEIVNILMQIEQDDYCTEKGVMSYGSFTGTKNIFTVLLEKKAFFLMKRS